MAQPRDEKLTIEDHQHFPDDGKRYEILSGKLVVTPSPTYEHQSISANLLFLIATYLRQNPIGEFLHAPLDVILANDTVCQPDLLYIRKERLAEIASDWVRGAPDLAIEILSPSSAILDMHRKKIVYARFGIREYWVVDPASRTVLRHLWADGGYGEGELHEGSGVIVTPLLPGLEIPLLEIFPALPSR